VGTKIHFRSTHFPDFLSKSITYDVLDHDGKHTDACANIARSICSAFVFTERPQEELRTTGYQVAPPQKQIRQPRKAGNFKMKYSAK
jgi:hypothetical protein